MNDNGISVDEACKMHAIGTEEAFAQNCNEDRTVKAKEKTTTFTTTDGRELFTVRDTYIHFTGIVIVIILVMVSVLAAKKLRGRRLVKR